MKVTKDLRYLYEFTEEEMLTAQDLIALGLVVARLDREFTSQEKEVMKAFYLDKNDLDSLEKELGVQIDEAAEPEEPEAVVDPPKGRRRSTRSTST